LNGGATAKKKHAEWQQFSGCAAQQRPASRMG
jgi:hypothetical protein